MGAECRNTLQDAALRIRIRIRLRVSTVVSHHIHLITYSELRHHLRRLLLHAIGFRQKKDSYLVLSYSKETLTNVLRANR